MNAPIRHHMKISPLEEEYEVIKAYAEIMGSTPSGIIRELITEIIPSFQSVVHAVQSVKDNKREALLKVQGVLISGIANASGFSSEVQREIENL